jgi:CheY-like chemotaxis protein
MFTPGVHLGCPRIHPSATTRGRSLAYDAARTLHPGKREGVSPVAAGVLNPAIQADKYAQAATIAIMLIPQPSHRLQVAIAPPMPRHPHILLIEDDKDSIRWVQHAFKKHGEYKLEFVSYLSDGLSRLLDGGIDIILLDLGLPDSSNLFTYAWVREAAPEVPILVFTADSREEVDFSVVPRDANNFLVKGQLSASNLMDAIAEALAAGNLPQH